MNKQKSIPGPSPEEGDFSTSSGDGLRETSIFPVFYLAPIEYFALLLKAKQPVFEVHEHFVKQTYRNRCCIAGANGKLNLIIPIKHTGERTPLKETEIANDGRWQKIHWRSIQTAYRTSCYFEFYEHIFAPYYEKEYNFLIDYNFALQEEILKILEAPSPLSIGEGQGVRSLSYQKEYPNSNDLRNHFPPKFKTFILKPETDYHQVFSNKSGFIPNLSIVDLIFNTGPEAKEYFDGKP